MIGEKLFLRCFHTAYTRADYYAASVRIEILEVASCVLYSLVSRIYGILCDYICTAKLFLVKRPSALKSFTEAFTLSSSL